MIVRRTGKSVDAARSCRLLLQLVLVSLGCVLWGCSESPSSPKNSVHEPSDSHPRPDLHHRIVSLSPAITRGLVDLGLESCIVGRSAYCTAVDDAIPVIGDLHTVGFEILVRVDPTHVLLQQTASASSDLMQLAEEHEWSVTAWPLSSIDEIAAMVRSARQLFSDVDDVESRADAWLNRLDDLTRQTDRHNSYAGRVLLASRGEPVLAFGAGTYLEDLLKMMGAQNAIDDAGWISLSLEDVAQINPDAIIIISEVHVDVVNEILYTIDTRARKNRRIAALVDTDINLPSTSVLNVADALHTILMQWQQDAERQ
ncbi:MAG: ABC transporter substrate-binding protein [Phycisphaerales bacterium]